MKSKQYFISIGPYCKTVELLKRYNLRLEAFPFDYIYSSLEMIKHCINDKFNIFLDKKYYTIGTDKNSNRHTFYCKMLDTDLLLKHHIKQGYNKNYKVSSGNLFNHHNLLHNEETYNAFKRRCYRFMNIINQKSDKVNFVYFNKYTNNIDDLVEFSNYLKLYYENTFIIGIFQNKNDPSSKILYKSNNCIIYQNYDIKLIFDLALNH